MNTTLEKIKYTALKLFLEKGYEATNIREICKEVNIKPSSLYFYYTAKHELFLSLYNEIWEENIQLLNEICVMDEDIFPNMKLYYIYKKLIEYYAKTIIKQKFLLRYHLFPPQEVFVYIQERFKYWTEKENEILLKVINQCLGQKILHDKISPYDYLYEFKRFISSQEINMLIDNIKVSDNEMDKLWIRFWNGTMLNLL